MKMLLRTFAASAVLAVALSSPGMARDASKSDVRIAIEKLCPESVTIDLKGKIISGRINCKNPLSGQWTVPVDPKAEAIIGIGHEVDILVGKGMDRLLGLVERHGFTVVIEDMPPTTPAE